MIQHHDEGVTGACVPPCPARSPQVAGDSLQAEGRRRRLNSSGSVASNLAPVHRRCYGDPDGARPAELATGAAMVVVGLLSVVLFPLGALTVMRSAGEPASVGHRDGPDREPDPT